MSSTLQTSSKPAMTGSCHCCAVTFSSTSAPSEMTSCYCRCCSKVHGAPFATFADVPTSDITWNGEMALYQVSSKAKRYFCKNCHTPLMMVYSDLPDTTGICATIIDEESLEKPLPKSSMNIYVKEKVGWYDIPENSGPSYDTFSPEWKEKYEWAR